MSVKNIFFFVLSFIILIICNIFLFLLCKNDRSEKEPVVGFVMDVLNKIDSDFKKLLRETVYCYVFS